MRTFAYHRPESIAEAVALLDRQDRHASRYLAGGTDLLTLMKGGIYAPDHLVDIKRLPEIDNGIAPGDDGGVSIGALATLHEVQQHSLIRETYAAVAKSIAVAATTQLRNMATIGGNLLQRPRCWYFRDEHIDCWLKGGEDCPARQGENQHHAIFGDSPCVAVHPSDPVNALLAFDATVTIHGGSGERTVPLSDLYAEPTADRRRETTIGDNEIVTAIHLPAVGSNTGSAYHKAMDRHAWSFALVSVAAKVEVRDGVISDAALVLGGVATIPWRVPEAEAALIGEAPSDEVFARVADLALAGTAPLARNGYKVPLLTSLIRRALKDAVPNP